MWSRCAFPRQATFSLSIARFEIQALDLRGDFATSRTFVELALALIRSTSDNPLFLPAVPPYQSLQQLSLRDFRQLIPRAHTSGVRLMEILQDL